MLPVPCLQQAYSAHPARFMLERQREGMKIPMEWVQLYDDNGQLHFSILSEEKRTIDEYGVMYLAMDLYEVAEHKLLSDQQACELPRLHQKF